MNRTPHVVGGGIGTIAKARQLQEQLRLEKLSKLRLPQVEIAMGFKYRGTGLDPMSQSPDHRVVCKALDNFLRAEKTEVDGVKKGAVAVAVEDAADELVDLFVDPTTSASALRGVDWATQALKWAGRKLYDAPKASSAPAQDVDASVTQ